MVSLNGNPLYICSYYNYFVVFLLRGLIFWARERLCLQTSIESHFLGHDKRLPICFFLLFFIYTFDTNSRERNIIFVGRAAKFL